MTDPTRLVAEHLTSIRQNTNWRQLFDELGIAKDPKKSKDHDWWGKSPLRPEEKTASFHMNVKGWYCHSTGRGGGPIELIQQLHPGMNCFQAGKWLLDHGVSRIVEDTRFEVAEVNGEETNALPVNPPIRQDLRKYLDPRHRTCEARGLSPEILHEIGAGYLERKPRKNGRHDPMNKRIVFQIRDVTETGSGDFVSSVVGHIGRATTDDQEVSDGKWWTYAGFQKSLELYNFDLALLDDKAVEQAKSTGHVLLAEGPFDVARLYAAGVRNAVASLGSRLSEEQVKRLRLLCRELGIEQVRLFYDRDDAGEGGTAAAFEQLSSADLIATSFNWDQTWPTPERGEVGIPQAITDPAEFSLGQLVWLRSEGLL